jgi:hypothetical protein
MVTPVERSLFLIVPHFQETYKWEYYKRIIECRLRCRILKKYRTIKLLEVKFRPSWPFPTKINTHIVTNNIKKQGVISGFGSIPPLRKKNALYRAMRWAPSLKLMKEELTHGLVVFPIKPYSFIYFGGNLTFVDKVSFYIIEDNKGLSFFLNKLHSVIRLLDVIHIGSQYPA